MTTEADLVALRQALTECSPIVVACSGGIDSLVLATVAHRLDPEHTIVAHTVTPAVPPDGTERVRNHAHREGWTLRIVESREFGDERYLSNPTDRCYFCKSNLYDAIDEIVPEFSSPEATVVSGANVDDLGEYRPGLVAAAEHGVRHPYVDAGIDKERIRAIARVLDLDEAELPASPCLASRLYTGTRVTPTRLAAVHAGEESLRAAGFRIVRCRRRDNVVWIELPDTDRPRISQDIIDRAAAAMQAVDPEIAAVELDSRPYRPGRAVIATS